MLTDAIALDKSVGAGSANSTDSGWPNSTSASGLDGFFAIGDDNATGLLESQTFNTSNTTTTSFFGVLSEASSNTTSNTESNETSQPDTNFTDAMATSSDSCMLVTMVTIKNQVWLDHDSKPITTTSVGLAHTLRGFSFSRTQNRLLKDGFSSFGTKCVGDRNRRANLLLSRHR